jgi:hypothetical protein
VFKNKLIDGIFYVVRREVRVYHNRLYIGMAEYLADRRQIHASHDQVRRARVT